MSFDTDSLRLRQLAAAVTLTLASLTAVTGCGEAPGWQKLLGLRIVDQFPSYRVQPAANGGLLVERPGLPTLPVDVDAIARFCQRGPKDCNYATDQMLLELQDKQAARP